MDQPIKEQFKPSNSAKSNAKRNTKRNAKRRENCKKQCAQESKSTAEAEPKQAATASAMASIMTSTPPSAPQSTSIPLTQAKVESKLEEEQIMSLAEDVKDLKIEAEPTTSRARTISLAEQTIANNNAIVRYFSSPTLDYDVPVDPSQTTYWGMYEVLCKLSQRLKKNGLKPEEHCVLCPRYALTGRKTFPGGDTQACGGGKTAKVWSSRENRYLYEAFTKAAHEELLEELRVIGGTPRLESEIETLNWSKTSRSKIPNYFKMYSFKVSECKAPVQFDTTEYARKDRRGEDVFTEKVGFVPWGTLDECIRLVQSIPVDIPLTGIKPMIVDGIDAISIVSLPKAIDMALYAAHNLRGDIIHEHYF